MTKKKSPSVTNEPIVLSGRVYLDGILADDLPSLALPAKLMVGDIKLHNVPKAGNRQRFGQAHSFAGFIVANVYDGKRYRKLLLRKLGAVESTYVGPVGRREVSASCVRYLRTLVRRQAVWVANDHGYEVTRNTVAAVPPQTVAPANPVAGTTAVVEKQPTAAAPAKDAAALAVTVTVKVEVEGQPPVTTTSHHGRMVAPRRKRSRKAKAVDQNQLPLF
jgi:hypothetical protein